MINISTLYIKMKRFTLLFFWIVLSVINVTAILPNPNPNHNNNLFPIDDFGSNKPHLLFHIGQRERVSMNIGWGYWKHKSVNFSDLRSWYQNTKNGLYCDMKSHNGRDHFQQYVQDRNYNINSNLKYQLKRQDKQWQTKIQMRSQNQSSTFTAYTSFWIENTDDQLIDKKGYSSPKAFQLQQVNDYHVQVKYFNYFLKSSNDQPYQIFNIHSKGQQKLKVFGLGGNISETYNSMRIVNEFKDLLQLIKYPDIQRDNITQRVEWQNNQINLINENNWKGRKYIFAFVYSEFSTSLDIEMSNGTTKAKIKTASNLFDSSYHDNTKDILKRKYFGDHEKGQFLRHIVFNLLGGIAYYEGKLYTQNSLIPQQHSYVYGMTPSRLIFPRSFLWDDGFHLMVISDLQPTLVLNFLENWMNKIDPLGWIGRQQIRGFQMAFLMPDATFVFQDSFQMNPPTLFFVIQHMLSKGIEKQNLLRLLERNFFKLQNWYRYFRKTQSHYNLIYEEQIEKTPSYRWRCKDQCKKGNFMGSGLDDYPRTSNSNQISKKHVDIISWIVFFTRQLEKITLQLISFEKQKHNKARLRVKNQYYKKQYRTLSNTLKQYIDLSDNLFKDIAVKSEQIYIDQFVSHNGYITLFPFLLEAIQLEGEQNENLVDVLKNTISLILDQSQLLSEDGIRSLSKKDPLYGTEDNYWRGPVWMNIQFLILKACYNYHEVSKTLVSQDQDLQNLLSIAYKTIRERVISSVESNYNQTGYLFQNYHLGKGNRGHPFYGWTSIISNIVTMKEQLK